MSDPIAGRDASYTDGWEAGRDELLSRIPEAARPVIAAWLEAYAASDRSEKPWGEVVMIGTAQRAMTEADAWQHLDALARMLRGEEGQTDE